MSNVSITLAGITQAIENLNYRPGSVKSKAISSICSFYTSEQSIQELRTINTDTLVSQIWDVGDNPSRIRSKRRNFSSLKSAINSDLKKLSKKGLNPEDLIISDTNIFDMTEEAKTSLLHSFTDAVQTGDIDLAQATDILKAVAEFLNEIDISVTRDESLDIISEIKKVLGRLGSHLLEPEDEIEEIEADEDVEEIELDEDEDLEEIEELDEDQEIEEIELDEDEEIEEIQEDDALELDEDEDLEAVDELDEDLDEIELDEDEDLEEIEELDEDQEIEEIDLDEDEELEEVDELDEEELAALEDFRNARELAEDFDQTLGDREKKFNAYVKIPKGIYTIGTQKALKSSLELQQFEMPLVYMGKYPVTNALFEIFIEQTGYTTTAEKKGFGTVFHARYSKKKGTASWKKQAGSREIEGACWYQPAGPGSTLHEKRNHPVVQVSVADAIAYASWIGRRLPTEAEWEAAARTDLGYKYPWGNRFDPNGLNIEKTGISDTSSVEAYDAHSNEFGLADILGNVMEWTSDREPPPFKTRDKRLYNVAKGGAWNGPDTVTISSRGLFKADFTANTIGFRCISELFQ